MNALLSSPHASYVLGAYAVFFAVLLWDALSPWVRHRRTLGAIRARARREAARSTPVSPP